MHLNCGCTLEALDAWATSPDFGVTGLRGSPEQLPRNSPWIGSSEKSVKVKVLVAQWCPTLCNPVDCSLPGSSVHGILQAGIPEWIAIPFSRGSSQPREATTENSALAVLNACRFLSCSTSFCLCLCYFRLFISAQLPLVNLPWPSWQRPLLWYYSTVRFVLNASMSTQ